MDEPSPPEALTELAYYRTHFMDPVLWEPCVRWVAQHHGFNSGRIIPGFPGTYPTFLVELVDPQGWLEQDCIVVKLFGPLFEGASSFGVELAMGCFVAQHSLSIPSPRILAEGKLSPGWCYLVFEHIPGISIGQVRQELTPTTMESVAWQMGQYMRELHTLTATHRVVIPSDKPAMSWAGYADFLNRQRQNCLDTHLRWHDLPVQLLNTMENFLLPAEELFDDSAPPHLVHADLTGDHLLGRLTSLQGSESWESLAIIDWGDCRLGNVLYELVALYVDFFQFDQHLLRVCLESYRLPVFFQEDFARKALNLMLLHPFPMPGSVLQQHGAARSLAELAERLFGGWSCA